MKLPVGRSDDEPTLPATPKPLVLGYKRSRLAAAGLAILCLGVVVAYLLTRSAPDREASEVQRSSRVTRHSTSPPLELLEPQEDSAPEQPWAALEEPSGEEAEVEVSQFVVDAFGKKSALRSRSVASRTGGVGGGRTGRKGGDESGDLGRLFESLEKETSKLDQLMSSSFKSPEDLVLAGELYIGRSRL